MSNSFKQMLNIYYPTGTIYITYSSVSPAYLIGGTWEKIEGRFLLLGGSTYTTAGATGGTKDAVNPSHYHSTSSHNHGYYHGHSMGHSHGLGGVCSFTLWSSNAKVSSTIGSHGFSGNWRQLLYDAGGDWSSQWSEWGGGNRGSTGGVNTDTAWVTSTGTTSASSGSATATMSTVGSSGTGLNMPAYTVANIWKRVG